MNKIFQHGSPQNKPRNTITKPLAIDYDSDFQKLNSATQTVKDALELLSSIQKLKEEAELAEEKGPESGVQKTVIQGINLLKSQVQTAEAVTLISNVTILPSPENTNPVSTKRTQVNYRQRPKQGRPHSGYQQSNNADPKRIIDLEKIEALQPDIVRNANGTLTPQNNIKRDQSGRALNTLLEFQSSHRSRQNLIKSTSNASKNADIEYLIKEKSQNFSQKSNDQLGGSDQVNQENQEVEAIALQSIERRNIIEDVISPPSIEFEKSSKQLFNDVPKTHAGHQTQEQLFYPIAPQQIAQVALISEKAKFSQLAWNISLMKQDSYNILSSKDLKSHINSERIPASPEQINQVCMIPQALEDQEHFDFNSDSKPLNSYISTNQKQFSAQQTGCERPKLINLTDNTNIQMYLQRQSYEKQLIKMNSTAQLNKLSSGVIHQQNVANPQTSNRLRSPLSAGFNRPQSFRKMQGQFQSTKQHEQTTTGRNVSQHVNSNDLIQIQRGQPVKVKVMLSQTNETRFKQSEEAKNIKAIQKIRKVENINIETENLTENENVVFDLPSSSRTQPNSHRLEKSTQRDIPTAQNFNTAIINEEQLDDGQELKKQIEIKSSIVYKKKNNDVRKSQDYMKSTKEVSQLVDKNLREIDGRRQQDTLHINNDLVKEGAFSKLQESKPNKQQIGSKITSSNDKRASTLLERSDQLKQKTQKQADSASQWYQLPSTPFTQVCQDLPSANNQGAILNTGNSVIQESKILVQDQQKKVVKAQTVRQQPQNKLSQVQRRTFNEKLVGLARIINNQTEEENVKFTQKYTNLMEKHSIKNWVTNDNKQTEAKTNQGKSQRTIMSGRTAQTNNTIAKKNPESVQVANHPLSFLGLQNIANLQQNESAIPQILSGIKLNGIQRPKTTKSAMRVAIIQEKSQPLPPPSARNQRRVGADMNFLKTREDSAIDRQSGKRGVLDLRMSNYQIIFRNSSETTNSTQFVPISLPMSSAGKQAFEKAAGEGRINFHGEQRAEQPNSLLFSQLNVKNQ